MSRVHDTSLRRARLVVTTHAAHRWAARVRGDDQLPTQEAESDLMRCARVAEVRAAAPEWLLVGDDDPAGSRYLMLGDDVAIVVVPINRGTRWAATTVVTRTDAGSVDAARRRSARHLRLRRQREREPRRTPRERRSRPIADPDD
jgi:hypothetical protein